MSFISYRSIDANPKGWAGQVAHPAN